MANGTLSTITTSRLNSNIQEAEAKLLEGQFYSHQAKEHVLGLLTKSIQHHWLQSFKHHERTMESNVLSDAKMIEPSETRDKLLQMLEQAESNNQVIDIEATLSIKILSDNTSQKTSLHLRL